MKCFLYEFVLDLCEFAFKSWFLNTKLFNYVIVEREMVKLCKDSVREVAFVWVRIDDFFVIILPPTSSAAPKFRTVSVL